MNKEQTMIYSDKELSLIKNTFAEDIDVLKLLRKIMLQAELTEAEEIKVKGWSKEVKALIRKVFLPTLDMNAPIHQVIDLMMTVSIKDSKPEDAVLSLKARQKVIDYIDQRLYFIEKGEDNNTELTISFKGLSNIDKDPELIFVDMTARNTILGHVEQQLEALNILAGQKKETVDETMERLKKDSSQ